MWNSDIPAYGADTDPLYQTVPFFYGMKNGKAYGLFFDNTYWSSFDFGKESRTQYSFGAENGELDYYFFQGPAPSKILQRYTELVGRMPLPPLWSLGYQQCRWSYAPESRVREIARGFRSRNIPCDVIYLDIDYMDGYRIFTWNKTGFPDPARMISDLSDDGFHIAVIVDPGIKADTVYHAYRSGRAGDHFIKYPDGRTFIGKVWPGLCAFPDFTNAAARTWWGENFSVLTSAGIRGWWNDMNEPSVFDVPTKTVDLDVVHRADGFTTDHAASHNIYGMQMTRATYDGVRTLLPNERPFVLTRASYAGGQRYSAAWTGDNVASWDHLRMAVSMCLSMSISGQPFVGSDIGGFIGYPSGELFTRWLQFGVFSPLMRAHSVINEKNKEPWEFGDDLTAINRETINLRYRLLPYIYNCMRQASVTGIPPMRPMIFSYPDDAENIWNDDQFMFGDDLLVAPVINAGATSREVRLPRGTWYDFRTGVPHEGGRTITVAAPLQEIPIFVRAGAIIPTRPIVQYTQQAPIDPLTFILYPTELQSTSTYYEDDGISFKYEKGGSLERVVNQWYSSEKITITLGSCRGTYAPSRRSLALRVVNIATAPKEIQLNGRQLLADSPSSARSSSTGWSYDPATKIVTVTFPDARDEQRLAILR
jgi:alpha-glucosidase